MGKSNHRQLSIPFSLSRYIPTKRSRKKSLRDFNRKLYEWGIDQGYSKVCLNAHGMYEKPTEQHTRELPSKSNQRMHKRRIRKRAEKQQ